VKVERAMPDVTPNVLDPTSIQKSIESLNSTITKSKSAAAERQNQLKQAETQLAITEALLKAVQLDGNIATVLVEKQQSIDKAKGQRDEAARKLEEAEKKLASVRKIAPEEVDKRKKELEAKTALLTQKQLAVTAAEKALQEATLAKKTADDALAAAKTAQEASEKNHQASKAALEKEPTQEEKAAELDAERAVKAAKAESDKANAQYELDVRRAEQKYTEAELQVRRDQLEVLQLVEDKSQPPSPKAG
jgi:hypothetical protein